MDPKFPHCTLTHHWICRGQEVVFSCRLSSSFAILHINLWIPGYHTDNNGNMTLTNAIYDMSQFVVVVPVPDENSTILASYFMQYILMKFGLCHLVVLNDGTVLKELLLLCAMR